MTTVTAIRSPPNSWARLNPVPQKFDPEPSATAFFKTSITADWK